MKKVIYLFALFSIFAFASCGGGGIEKKQKTFSFDDKPNCQKECCSGSELTEEVASKQCCSATKEAEGITTEEVASKQCCSATKEAEEVASEKTAD